jgi:hypothetical protein
MRYVLLFIAILIIPYIGIKLSSVEMINIDVQDKERITTGSGKNISSKFIVYTDGEVFENTDTILFSKWNSTDIQGYLKGGESYTVKVVGWRIPFLSTYRNIISVNGFNH